MGCQKKGKWRKGNIRRREVYEMGCQKKGSGEKGTSEEGKWRRWGVRREVEKRGRQKKGSVGDGMSEERKWRKGDVRRREVEEMGCQKGRRGDGMSEEVEDMDVRREVGEMGRQKKGSGGEKMGCQKKGSGGEKMGCQKKGSGGEKMGCQKKGNGGEEMSSDRKWTRGEGISEAYKQRKAGNLVSTPSQPWWLDQGESRGANMPHEWQCRNGSTTEQKQTAGNARSGCKCLLVLLQVGHPQHKGRREAFSPENSAQGTVNTRVPWPPPHKGRRVAKSPENCSGHSEYTSTHAPPGLLVFNGPDTVAEPNKQAIASTVQCAILSLKPWLDSQAQAVSFAVVFHSTHMLNLWGWAEGRRVKSGPPLQFCNQTSPNESIWQTPQANS